LEPFATPQVLWLVKLLTPHLQRAMQTQLGFGALNQLRDSALDLVDQWRHGCVVVSFSGQVIYANRAASEIAASRDGLSLGTRGHPKLGRRPAFQRFPFGPIDRSAEITGEPVYCGIPDHASPVFRTSHPGTITSMTSPSL
jgi:hypothetical protein